MVALFINLSTVLVRKEHLAKMNNLLNHHMARAPKGAGPNAAASVASA